MLTLKSIIDYLEKIISNFNFQTQTQVSNSESPSGPFSFLDGGVTFDEFVKFFVVFIIMITFSFFGPMMSTFFVSRYFIIRNFLMLLCVAFFICLSFFIVFEINNIDNIFAIENIFKIDLLPTILGITAGLVSGLYIRSNIVDRKLRRIRRR